MNVANPTIYLLACTDRKYPHGEDFIAMYIDRSVTIKINATSLCTYFSHKCYIWCKKIESLSNLNSRMYLHNGIVRANAINMLT